MEAAQTRTPEEIEADIKKTKAEKEEEELKAQIEVYEGQSYESREKYQEVKQKYSKK